MPPGVAHGLHGLALDAHRRGELDRAARLMARAARLDVTLLPLAEELNAQAAAAAGATAARAEADAEAETVPTSSVPTLAQPYGSECAHDAAAGEAPAAARDAARRALPPRPRAFWRASWHSRLLAVAAALLALALHEALGMRLLPRRGSAAFTALLAACVALPLAHALPTTSSRRRAALLSPPTATQLAFDDMAPASPPRAPLRRGTAAAAAARARAADAWLRALADNAETDGAFAAAQTAPPAAGCDASPEVRRVLRAADHFAVLNVGRDADATTARRAYRRAALLLHPDKCGAGLPGAPAAWQRVQAAGETLADDASRSEYAAALWRAENAARAKRQPMQPARRRARRWAGLL